VVLTVVRMLTAFALDILMGAGATRWTLWVNLAWATALVPALYYGTAHDQIRGAAIAHAFVAVLVPLPLVLLALHRVGVRLMPIVPALVRPVFGGVIAGLVGLAGIELVGPRPFLALVVAGGAGVLAYLAIGIPYEWLRRWRSVIRPEAAHAAG